MVQLDGSVRTTTAHARAWVLSGKTIPDGHWVLHHCDHRLCCRPSHLFTGTPQDNVDDMIAKGRQHHWPKIEREHPGQVRGVRCHTARLNDDLVREIRRRWDAGGVTQGELARAYGISQAQVSKVVLRQSWAHVA